MDPGELRQELTVEKNTPVPRAGGTTDPSWAAQTPNPIRAKIEQLSGAEYVEAQALAAGAKLRVTIRNFSGLGSVLYRFKRYGTSEVLNILHVNDMEERGVWMVVLCGEDVS